MKKNTEGQKKLAKLESTASRRRGASQVEQDQYKIGHVSW
jgi:hypothetical protein